MSLQDANRAYKIAKREEKAQKAWTSLAFYDTLSDLGEDIELSDEQLAAFIKDHPDVTWAQARWCFPGGERTCSICGWVYQTSLIVPAHNDCAGQGRRGRSVWPGLSYMNQE